MSDTLTDSFTILHLSSSATEGEIKKAYRKLSLKFHPDKVSKDVDPAVAASRFHQLNLAYETLMDPAARAKASQKSKDDAERKARQDKYQGKRKAMADELEREEREASKRKRQEREQQRKRYNEVEELKREARRLREERIKAAQEAEQQADQGEGSLGSRPSAPAPAAASTATQSASNGAPQTQRPPSLPAPPPLGPLDLTTLLRFPTTHYTYLIGQSPTPSDSIDATTLTPPSSPLSTPLSFALSHTFGPLTDLRFQLPAVKKKSKKTKSELTAFASFARFEDAWRAVEVGGKLECPGKVLADVWFAWAAVAASAKSEGETAASNEGMPERVRWYEQRGIDSRAAAADSEHTRTNGAFNGVDAHSRSPSPSSSPQPFASPHVGGGFSFKPMPSFTSFGSNSGSGGTKPKPNEDKGGGYAIDAGYESATLQRLRDAERKRLEEEIIRAEQDD